MAAPSADGSSSSDESIDATSDKFDPLKTLYSTKTKLLKVKAPVHDNVGKFESILKGLGKGNVKKEPKAETSKKKSKFSESDNTAEPAERLYKKNVLTKMQNTFGPLGMLWRYMENRTRVKVYTRGASGIRGHVEAFVVAFDKHWNLALVDCLETWTRKVKRKAPVLGASGAAKSRLEQEGVVPKVLLKSTDGKTETLERHVAQMMVRGEQVVMITNIQ